MSGGDRDAERTVLEQKAWPYLLLTLDVFIFNHEYKTLRREGEIRGEAFR